MAHTEYSGEFKDFLLTARDQICEIWKEIAKEIDWKAGRDIVPSFIYNWDQWSDEKANDYGGWSFFKHNMMKIEPEKKNSDSEEETYSWDPENPVGEKIVDTEELRKEVIQDIIDKASYEKEVEQQYNEPEASQAEMPDQMTLFNEAMLKKVYKTTMNGWNITIGDEINSQRAKLFKIKKQIDDLATSIAEVGPSAAKENLINKMEVL